LEELHTYFAVVSLGKPPPLSRRLGKIFITDIPHRKKINKERGKEGSPIAEEGVRALWNDSNWKCGSPLILQYFTLRTVLYTVPSRDVTTKLSLGGNNDVITELFLPRGSLVSDIPAGDGKLVNLVYGACVGENVRGTGPEIREYASTRKSVSINMRAVFSVQSALTLRGINIQSSTLVTPTHSHLSAVALLPELHHGVAAGTTTTLQAPARWGLSPTL
jgi:hypothetical protein